MNDIKLKPYDDYEKVKKNADEYIQRILWCAKLLENYGIKPTVFMSVDVISVISRYSERALFMSRTTPTEETITVCGYKVRTVHGEGVLSVGLDVL